MKSSAVLFILIMLLIAISCKEETTAFKSYNKPPYKSYYPLTVGNRWVYSIVYVDTLGKWQEIETAIRISEKLDIKYQGNELFSVQYREGQEDWQDYGMALSISPAGLLELKIKNNAVDHFYLSLPYHPNQGDIWYSLGYRLEVIDTNAVITTKVGSFKDVLVLKCYTIDEENDYYLFYYALGYGQIRVLHYTKDVLDLEKELIGYYPGSLYDGKP